jgi:hypothetical protein
MKQDRTCIYCNRIFYNEEGKIFSNHVRWCPKNTTNGDKGSANISAKTILHYIEIYGEIKEYEVLCEKCKTPFLAKEREKLHPERKFYFCSKACANSRGPRTKECKRLISQKLTGRVVSDRREITCKFCDKTLTITVNSKRQYCSASCMKKFRYKEIDKTSLRHYRSLCAFDFNLADYPEEFDFELVKKHGWYAPKNHGNNLGGVSRDHMFSIREGFEGEVPPDLISHPANCQLLIHNENVSKNKKSSVTLEELKAKIISWDAKYKSNKLI